MPPRWHDMPSGDQAPEDAIVSFDCLLQDTRKVGTHNVLIRKVIDIRVRLDGHARLYVDRSFVHVPTPPASRGA